MANGTIPFAPIISGATAIDFFMNTQNLPTLRFTTADGVQYQYVMWTNNRMILQKIEGGTITTVCTWTGA